MDKPIYQIESSPDGLFHIFESISEEKTVKKLVAYVPDEVEKLRYHLIFGDMKGDSLDVFAVSNNHDMVLVLSTVIKTLFEFFEKNPEKTVFFTGNTSSRTRLYRAIISKLMTKVELYYEIKGLNDDETIEKFDKSKTYKGYLISVKNEKTNKDFLGMDNFKVVINPNFPKINLDTPEIQAHLEKSRLMLKNLKSQKNIPQFQNSQR